MGKVFAAVHVDLGHTLAVKVMHPDMARDADSVKRFLREGRAAALLKSDHAARINDVGRLPSGVPYLVMEYLEGEDLDRRRKRAPLSADEVVDYMLQALAAITEAHGAGLVHRDLKPQNLFLAQLPDGRVRVKVVDFGLAKDIVTADRSNSALTTDNMILGSPHFMSPEQIRNPMGVDGRTDIWALGATMFMLLTGQPPFVSSTTHGLLALILTDSPRRVSELNAGVPPALAAIIDRCLAKNIDARFQTALDLSAALRGLSPGEGARASTRGAAAPPTVVGAPFMGAGPGQDDGLEATRVQPISNPAIPTRGSAHAAQPTLLAAGAVVPVSPSGVPATLPLGTQSVGVPPTVQMGTAPMPATPKNGGFTSTLPSPQDQVEPRSTRHHPSTLLSEPIRFTPSVAPNEPAAAAASTEAVSAPRAGSARRVATAALVIVLLAASIVGVMAIRAARTPAEQRGVRAIEPAVSAGSRIPEAEPVSSSAATAPPASAPSESAPPPASAAAAPTPPPLTASASPPAPAAPIGRKLPKTAPPLGPAAPTPTKDPYSWGK
jgi:serine/threonine-protein kinase